MVTVNGPSHFDVCSVNNLTRSPGSMRSFLAGGSFNYNALCILDSATIVPISVIASSRDSNRSVGFESMFEIHGNLSKVPSNSRGGTNPVGPIVSLIVFIEIQRIVLPDSFFYSYILTSNMILSG